MPVARAYASCTRKAITFTSSRTAANMASARSDDAKSARAYCRHTRLLPAWSHEAVALHSAFGRVVRSGGLRGFAHPHATGRFPAPLAGDPPARRLGSW